VSFLVAISGRRGSGKTFLAERLATTEGFAAASFGDVVRTEALKRGLQLDVESLQTFGVRLLNEWGAPTFCDKVLESIPPARDAVVEGIRHMDVLESLKAKTSANQRKFVAVFVEVSERERRRRLRLREDDEGRLRDQHEVEAEVAALRETADLLVNGESANPAKQVTKYLMVTDRAWRPRTAF
jgi:cytidylate kinase